MLVAHFSLQQSESFRMRRVNDFEDYDVVIMPW